MECHSRRAVPVRSILRWSSIRFESGIKNSDLMYVSACRKSEHIWICRSELASIYQVTHLILHLGLTDWAFSVPSLESSPPHSPPVDANRIAHDHDGGVAANIEDTSPIAKNKLQDNVQPEAVKWTRDASYTSSVGPSVDSVQWWLQLRAKKVAL